MLVHQRVTCINSVFLFERTHCDGYSQAVFFENVDMMIMIVEIGEIKHLSMGV